MHRWDINWTRIIGASVVTYALVVPLWVAILGRHNPVSVHYGPFRSASPGQRAWKFLASDAAYLFFYIAAGAIIFPFVKGFYANHMPSMGRIAAVQLLIRGPVFVCLCLLLVRMLGLPKVSGALAVGATFSILNGVAPLLLPNPYLPDAVRWVHLAEIGSSSLLFGVFVGWVWGQTKSAAHLAESGVPRWLSVLFPAVFPKSSARPANAARTQRQDHVAFLGRSGYQGHGIGKR